MTMTRKNLEFDAKKYILGDLCSKIAVILQGKDLPDYKPNMVKDVNIVVTNADQIKVSGNKREDKIYTHYTGYAGNSWQRTLEEQVAFDSREVIRAGIFNMLPKNRLRKRIMKNVQILKKEKK